MSEERLRRIAAIGLALAAVGMVATGLHHVRCTATVVSSGASGASGSIPCVETYPEALLVVAAIVGFAGIVAALGAAYALGRADSKLTAGRVIVAVASIALLAPTALPILGWASVGFDLAVAQPRPEGGSQCTEIGGSPPFWLQTPTCLAPLDVVATPLIALAGVLATIAAARGSWRTLLASVGVAALVLALFVAAILAGAADLARSSLVPLLGILLAAAAIPLLRAKRLSGAAQ